MAYLEFQGIPLWEHLWSVPTVYVLSALGQSGTQTFQGIPLWKLLWSVPTTYTISSFLGMGYFNWLICWAVHGVSPGI